MSKTTKQILSEQLGRMGDTYSPAIPRMTPEDMQPNTRSDLSAIVTALDDARATAQARSTTIILPTGERDALRRICRHVTLAMDAARRTKRTGKTVRLARFTDSIVIR